MDLDLGKLKWERRKRVGYAPSLRSGCSMTHWASKGMGVLFGGVLDEEKDEDDFERETEARGVQSSKVQ